MTTTTTSSTYNDYITSDGYEKLKTMSTDDLTTLYNSLTESISDYQKLEDTIWKQQQSNADSSFATNQETYYQQQKLLDLANQRDVLMQKLMAEYEKNTSFYDAAMKINKNKDYIKGLQDTLNSINGKKLGDLNSDLMTYNRVAAINTEQYRKIYNANQYMKTTIIFEALLFVILFIAYLKFEIIPVSLLRYVAIILCVGYVLLMLYNLYSNLGTYRMLNVEKEFSVVPADIPSDSSAEKCGCNSDE